MKILVFSDSHGNSYNIKRAMDMHPNASAAIFLGDGLSDFLSIPPNNAARLYVRGNCDWHPEYSFIPAVDSVTIDGKKIVFLHGHTHSAKSGMEALRSLAEDMGAHILLFGHTHVATEYYENGIYYMNPGTIGGKDTAPTYGIITLRENGILLSHGKF